MKSSTKRMISILVAIFLLIASVIIYNVFIKPAYAEIKELRNRAETLKQTFNNYNLLNKKFQDISAQYKNLGDLEKQLSLFLPAKFNVAYVVNQISGIAKNNKLNLLSFTIKQSTVKNSDGLIKGVGVLRIDAKLTGNYENFKKFITDIETNIMISDIVSFKIGKAIAGANLDYTVIIDTYYQTE